MRNKNFLSLGLLVLIGFCPTIASAEYFKIKSEDIVSAVITAPVFKEHSSQRTTVLSLSWIDASRSIRKSDYYCSTPEECKKLKDLILTAQNEGTDLGVGTSDAEIGSRVTSLRLDDSAKRAEEIAHDREIEADKRAWEIAEAARISEIQRIATMKATTSANLIDANKYLSCWGSHVDTAVGVIQKKINSLSEFKKMAKQLNLTEEEKLGLMQGTEPQKIKLRFDADINFELEDGKMTRASYVNSKRKTNFYPYPRVLLAPPGGGEKAEKPAVMPAGTYQVVRLDVTDEYYQFALDNGVEFRLGRKRRIPGERGVFVSDFDHYMKSGGDFYNALYEQGINLVGGLDKSDDCLQPKPKPAVEPTILRSLESGVLKQEDERLSETQISEVQGSKNTISNILNYSNKKANETKAMPVL